MKERIMLDSNAFDDLLESKLDYKLIGCKFEFYITSIQIKEIKDIPDSKKDKRNQILDIIADLRAKIVPTPFSWDYIDFSHFSFSSEPSYWTVLKKTKGNIKDATIAATAILEGCVLVTGDKEILSRMKRLNKPAITFADFISDYVE